MEKAGMWVDLAWLLPVGLIVGSSHIGQRGEIVMGLDSFGVASP